MIYFDNAATTLKKPQAVIDAVNAALTSFGGPGRGSHGPAIEASMALFRAREAVSRLFGVPGGSSRVAFTLNATMALNIAIDALLPARGRAVTTQASHNSVLRPLFRARDERACSIGIARVAPDGSLDEDSYVRELARGADLVVATHASNVTGDVYDVARMAALAHDAGALFVLDAAQTAGAYPLDMGELGVDVVCFTGHKSLYGPQGTGGLAVREGVEVAPLLEGGSGVKSFEERQPRVMPESLEAGTANAHGAAGLAAGVEYALGKDLRAIADAACALAERFEEGIAGVSGVRLYGGHASSGRTGVVAFNLGDADSGEVAVRLWQDFGICVRPGAHCAPLMHRALGTESQGVVRASFSSFTTEEEIDEGIRAVCALAGDL